ncbi:MAG TPA: trypsin-like serine protease [Polyangiaceae bacterium]|nr:trypsin-like serine protease [Polyangiaceae bacterium]
MRRAALALAIAACSCARPEGGGPAGDAAAARSAIVGGASTAGDPAVVAIVARRVECEGASPTLLCSGTLVAPRAVLAAAHCLDAFGPEGAYEIVFGPSVEGEGVAVRGAEAHPAYDPATHEHDLALFELARDAPVAPAALPPAGFAPAPGAAARVVGYGVTRDEAEPEGVKRTGGTVVSAVTATAFEAAAAPSMSCSGDSGGPVLLASAAGEVVAGVTASGDPACRERAFNVRVDAHLDWLLARLGAIVAAPPAPEPSIAPGDLCSAACAGHAECPADLRCASDFSGASRCTLAGAGVGALGAACRADAECGGGGRCVRTSGAACACFRPCDPMGLPGTGGPPPPGASGGWGGDGDGCALATPARGGAGPFAALVTLWLVRRRGQSRRAGADGCRGAARRAGADGCRGAARRTGADGCRGPTRRAGRAGRRGPGSDEKKP